MKIIPFSGPSCLVPCLMIEYCVSVSTLLFGYRRILMNIERCGWLATIIPAQSCQSNNQKCFHQPDRPNRWEILWMGGCQGIHMSGFWNLQGHQSAGQRLQPGIDEPCRLHRCVGQKWSKYVRSRNQNHGRIWSSVLVMKHPFLGCNYSTQHHFHCAATSAQPPTRHHFARDPRGRW